MQIRKDRLIPMHEKIDGSPYRNHTLAPGLRAIPAARRAVIAFTVDDDAKEVLIHCITYSGGDWASRSRARFP